MLCLIVYVNYSFTRFRLYPASYPDAHKPAEAAPLPN